MILGPKSCPEDCSPEAWRLFCAAANGDLSLVQATIADSPELMHQFVWYECPLHYAVRENHADIVQTLIEAGINPAYSNFTYSSWQKLLPVARDRGFDEVLALLIAEMRKRFQYDAGYGPLWKAINAGDLAEVKALIGANPTLVHIGDEHGNRPLHWAILSRQLPIIELLLAAGADINAKRADMQSPLHPALEGNDYWFAKTNQADPDTTVEKVAEYIRDNEADYEFSAAIGFNDFEHVKAQLAKTPGLAKSLNDSRRSPLYLAVWRADIAMVRLLLEHGADPSLPEHCASNGRALYVASSRNDIEMMTLLIEHGANADAYVDSCGNCLSIAHQGGEREADAVRLLKQHGALPGEWELDTAEEVAAALDDETFIPNRDMWSSVLGKILGLDDAGLFRKYVARFGPGSVARMNPSTGWWLPKSEAMLLEMLKHGADVNAADWYGRTYLHYAAFDETAERAAWLVSNNADIDVIDHQSGTTALGLAAWSGGLAVVDFLLKAGANPSLPTNREWAQPLSFAKQQGHDEVVKRLQQNG